MHRDKDRRVARLTPNGEAVLVNSCDLEDVWYVAAEVYDKWSYAPQPEGPTYWVEQRSRAHVVLALFSTPEGADAAAAALRACMPRVRLRLICRPAYVPLYVGRLM